MPTDPANSSSAATCRGGACLRPKTAVSGVGASLPVREVLAPTLTAKREVPLTPEVNPRRLNSFAIYIAVFTIGVGLLSIPPLNAQQTDRAKQVGMKLMCICGCGQVLVQCNHIGCPSSVPMLKELDAHVARAESDDLIVQDFVQEYGVQVLSEPPRTGFNAVAWFLPGIAFAAGLAIVILVIASWRKRVAVRTAQPAPHNISPEMLARAREIADRATED